MQQKENFLSTQKGKIIAGSGGLVGIIVIYLLLSWMIGFWPFSKLTKDNISAMAFDPGICPSTISQDEATKKVTTLSNAYNKLKKAADKLKVNKDDVKTQLDNLNNSIESAQKVSSQKAEQYTGTAFATAYNTITKDSFQNLADAIIKAADLK